MEKVTRKAILKKLCFNWNTKDGISGLWIIFLKSSCAVYATITMSPIASQNLSTHTLLCLLQIRKQLVRMSAKLSQDAKKDEFRKYLEKGGVLELLTKSLVSLYEVLQLHHPSETTRIMTVLNNTLSTQ